MLVKTYQVSVRVDVLVVVAAAAVVVVDEVGHEQRMQSWRRVDTCSTFSLKIALKMFQNVG